MRHSPPAHVGILAQRLRQEFALRGWPRLERYARRPGETKVVHGRTYRLNENHRWERVQGPADPTPSIEVEGDEFGVDWTNKTIRESLLARLFQTYQGKRYVNAETGRQIQVGKKGLKKVVSHMPDVKPAMALAKLPELLERAVYVGSAAPREPDRNIRQWHYFESDLLLQGQPSVARVKIREDGNGHWFYDHEISVTQKKRDPPYQPGTSASGGTSAGESRTPKIIGPGEGEVKKNSRKGDLVERFARAFRDRGWPERYARHKPAANQGHLFREEEHPRNAEGEFTKKGSGQSGSSHPQHAKQVDSLAGQKDLFGGQTAKGTPATPQAEESATAAAKQRQTTLFHGLADAPGQRDLFDLDYLDKDTIRESQGPHPSAPSAKERQLYADYVKLVDNFRLSGKRDLESWVASYREQQAKLAARAESPSPAKPPTTTQTPAQLERKITKRKTIVEDFGEKIGGARKDTARKLGPRADRGKEGDERPGWMRRYQVSQITKSSRKEEEGKWVIHDTKSKNWAGQPRQVGSMVFATREEALAAVPLAEVARNHTTTSYRDQDGQTRYAIVRKVSDRKRPIVKGGFASSDEAQRYMAVNPTEIIEHQFPRYETFQYLDHVERTGGTNRSGDIRPKEFHTEFGFRGGEFGNWQQGQEGQVALNHAYDALHDLAEILNLPPRAVSLNGRLSIAFGARGTGGKMAARAHHEPDKRVINLTKMKGAGSLAHEWSHALDHYFGETADAERHPEARPAASQGLPYNHALRPEVAAAWKHLMDTMITKEVQATLDPVKVQAVTKKAREAVAERIADLEERLKGESRYNQRFKPFTAEQQKEWDKLKEQLIRGDVGKATWVQGKSRFGGYHSYEPLEGLNALYKASTGRSFHTADQKSLGSSIYWQVQHANNMDRRAKEAGEGQTETKRRKTAYFEAASRMDTTRESSYYSIPTEMLSRAFEAYVYDKLRQQDRKSEYLVAKAENKYYRMFDLEPFPAGDERAAINSAFDRFFGAIRHETASQEQGGHVRLYSRSAGVDAETATLCRALAARGFRIRYSSRATMGV